MIPTERPFLASELGLTGGHIRRLRCDGFIVPVGCIRHATIWQATDKLRKTPQPKKEPQRMTRDFLLDAVRENPGKTIRQLADIIGEDPYKTHRELKMLELFGRIQLKNTGRWGTGSAFRAYPVEGTI